MPSHYSNANAIVNVYRQTHFLMDAKTPTASMTLDRQPTVSSILRVQVNAGASGTVDITGTSDGATKTAQLSIVAGQRYVSTFIPFTAVTEVATSLSGGTSIAVKAVSDAGGDSPAQYLLKSGWPATKTHRRNRIWPITPRGSTPNALEYFTFQYDEAWAPRIGDIIQETTTGQTYEVEYVETPQSLGSLYPEKWVCSVMLREGILLV